MSGTPPDPSQPDQQSEMIRQHIIAFLSDPTQLPDQFTSWLGTYASLVVSSGPQPVIGAAINPASGPPPVIGP